LRNPFENICIDLKGEAFADEILFDDLPNQSEDTLTFDDCWIDVDQVSMSMVKLLIVVCIDIYGLMVQKSA
jgi:hypothetical protein